MSNPASAAAFGVVVSGSTRSGTESAGAEKAVGQVVVPRQRNVDLPPLGGR